MILVVRPLGEGYKEFVRYLWQSVLYVTSMVLASTLVGLGIGALGLLTQQAVLIPLSLAGVLALLFAARELGFLRLPLPERRWQVPISWVERRRYLGTLAYGFTIGLGYLTFIPYPGFWVWQASGFLSGLPWFGALLGALYGLGRSIPVLRIAASGLRPDPELPYRLTAFVLENQRNWRRGSALLLTVTGLSLLVLA